MSTYDSYETEAPRRHRSHRHHHHRDERDDPRYETTDTYVRGPAIVDPPYVSSRQDLTLRGREDSDLSIEEVPRAFPPPGTDDRYGPPARSRSVDRHPQYGQYLGDTRRSERDRDDDRRSTGGEKEKKGVRRRRSLSRNQKIMAAVGGAALAVGGKELWDYRQSKSQGGERKDRNILATAAVGAAGAFAGFEGADIYTKKFADKKEKEVKEKHAIAYDRDGHAIEYYSEEEKEEKPKKSRRKSIVEGAMGLAGLGAAAKAMGGHDDDRSDRGDRRDRDDRDDRRRRHSSESSRGSRRTKGDGERGRGKSPEGVAKFQQAAKAALLAGAAEAFRVRNEPGGWNGAKGKRILTAAIGAGGVGAAAAGDNPEHNSKRHLLEAVVGGLAGNRLINGARSDDGKSSHGGGGRHRSRSRSAMPLAALATAGLGAFAAKKHHDRSTSRSRDDRRRRSGSEDSQESRRPKRSKSVTDYARKGLAALGLNDAADDRHGSSRRDRDRDMDDSRSDVRSHKSSSRRHRDDRDRDRDLDSSDDDYDRNRRDDKHRDRDYDDRRSHRGSDGRNRRVAEGKQAISDSDSLGSSTDDNKRIKKMKGKQFLTAGLATVATIHAAHNIYQSVEKRKAGHRAVAEGDMTPEEARKEKAKARMRTAASVGIAGLGIKGAISEWKEMSEMREEYRKAEIERAERHQKRCDRAATRSNQGRSRRVSPSRRIADAPYQSSSDLSPPDARNSRQRLYIDDDPYAPYSQELPRPPGFDSRDSRDSRRR
ncbi:hypothetical protein V501_04135 [Pseudogymnoascus sp. VKM F-4519 (FW-2642)]|nr:hypothetical protein V501_04135 [Pseudogymnoascus sp. VKM F-4519 (FW-2642)]